MYTFPKTYIGFENIHTVKDFMLSDGKFQIKIITKCNTLNKTRLLRKHVGLL